MQNTLPIQQTLDAAGHTKEECELLSKYRDGVGRTSRLLKYINPDVIVALARKGPRFLELMDAYEELGLDVPTGGAIPLEMVADISVDRGPNYISRENVMRTIVIQANVADRDLHMCRTIH